MANLQTIYQVNRGETWKSGELRFIDYCREPFLSDFAVKQDLASLARQEPSAIFRAKVEDWEACGTPDRFITL